MRSLIEAKLVALFIDETSFRKGRCSGHYLRTESGMARSVTQRLVAIPGVSTADNAGELLAILRGLPYDIQPIIVAHNRRSGIMFDVPMSLNEVQKGGR
jgi:hypothetical protein